VLVVDRLPGPGQGSTGASSAVVRFNYSTLDGVAAAWESWHHWADWAGHLDEHPAGSPLARLCRTGLVMLDAPAAPKERVLQMFDKVGVRYEVWDAAELAARVPGIDTGRYGRRSDLMMRRSGPSRPGSWARSSIPTLALSTIRSSPRSTWPTRRDEGESRSCSATRSTGIRRANGKVAGLDLADGQHIDARVVVNVAGPWSSALNRLAGVGEDFTISVRPMRQEVHHVPAPPGFNSEHQLGPVVADLDLGIYVRGLPETGC